MRSLANCTQIFLHIKSTTVEEQSAITGGGKLSLYYLRRERLVVALALRFHLRSKQIIWERTHAGLAAKRARGRNRRRDRLRQVV
ncbi:hypothetical protein [Coleofasciculus sp. FACHB-501]|uniref:hypothetical protein n=1 Tax=Cyanophyceae TaxID=3028117 RepID=UPI00168611F9|nr:hypothetical protein [Coleofasciculus sp. FACHB-501]MBD1837227.1 hypothetical protein [Coleofasciculus sp. FACHB-501]